MYISIIVLNEKRVKLFHNSKTLHLLLLGLMWLLWNVEFKNYEIMKFYSYWLEN